MTNAPSSLQARRVADRLLPATGFAYMSCDVPVGMTLIEWRRARNRARRAAEIAGHRRRRRAIVENLRLRIGRR